MTQEIATSLEMVRNGMLYLSGHCDGAASVDGEGFAKFDTGIGHDFAQKILKKWTFTNKQYAYMAKLCIKYRRQLLQIAQELMVILKANLKLTQ